MTHSEKVGKRLRELRLAKGLNGEELGAHLGIGKAAISAIELGKTKLNTDQLSILSKLFEVSSSYLMCEEEGVMNQLKKRVIQLEAVIDYFRGGDGSAGKTSQSSSTALASDPQEWEHSDTSSGTVARQYLAAS